MRQADGEAAAYEFCGKRGKVYAYPVPVAGFRRFKRCGASKTDRISGGLLFYDSLKQRKRLLVG